MLESHCETGGRVEQSERSYDVFGSQTLYNATHKLVNSKTALRNCIAMQSLWDYGTEDEYCSDACDGNQSSDVEMLEVHNSAPDVHEQDSEAGKSCYFCYKFSVSCVCLL